MYLLLFLALLLQGVAGPGRTGVVAGRLLTVDGGPATGVRVMAMLPRGAGDAESTVLMLTTTDGAGEYRLEDLPPGQYYIAAGAMDSPVYFPGVANLLEGKTTAVLPGATVANIDFRLVRAITVRDVPAICNITVRVIVDDGGPVPLLTFTKSNAGATASHAPQSDGTLKLAFIEGDHKILLKDIDPAYTVKSLTYGSTDLLKDSMKASPNASDEIRLILGPSKPKAWVKVSGRVADLNPSMTPRIVMTPIAASSSPPRTDLAYTIRAAEVGLSIAAPADMTAQIRANGTFEIPAVLPGSYRLSLSLLHTDLPSFSRSAHSPGMDASASLTVRNSDVSGIELGGSGQKRVRGVVRVDGDHPIPNFRLLFTGDSTASITVYPSVQPDGRLQANLPVGQYRLALGGLPGGYAVKSLRYGADNVLGGQIIVGSQDAFDLVFEFETTPALRTVKVAGRVQGSVSAGSRISMASAEAQQEAVVGTGGLFSFGRVLSGNQTVRFGLGSVDEELAVRVDGTRDWTALLFVVASGRVVFEGPSPPPLFSIDARNTTRDLPLMTSSTLTASRESRIRADGSFSLVLTGGEQQIRVVGLPDEYEVKAMRYGSTDILNRILKIGGDEVPAELTVTIGRKP